MMIILKEKIGMDLYTVPHQHFRFAHAMFSQTKLIANNEARGPLNFCDQTCLWCRSLRWFLMHLQQGKSKWAGKLLACTKQSTLGGINITHLGKRKIIFKSAWGWDMLVPWKAYLHLDLLLGMNCLLSGRRIWQAGKCTERRFCGPTRRSIFSGISMLVYRRVCISAQETKDGPEFTTSCESPGRARLLNVVEQAKAIRVARDLCAGCIILRQCSEDSLIHKSSEHIPNKCNLRDSEFPIAANPSRKYLSPCIASCCAKGVVERPPKGTKPKTRIPQPWCSVNSKIVVPWYPKWTKIRYKQQTYQTRSWVSSLYGHDIKNLVRTCSSTYLHLFFGGVTYVYKYFENHRCIIRW